MNVLTSIKSPVSLCGVREPDKVLSFLSAYGIRCVPWASNIGALIYGADAAAHWKYAQAVGKDIPLISEDDLFITNGDGQLWVDKYKPCDLKSVIGNSEPIAELRNWLAGWKPGSEGALVTGPPGIGKTTTVHLVVTEAGYDAVEHNASNERSAKAIKALFTEASKSHCVGRRRVVIMDEVDGMSSGDRGGVGELARIIRGCTFPVICIANERTAPRLRPIASACKDIRFQRPVRSAIARALMSSVVKSEGIKITAAELESLCERNGNDIRQILNYLQFEFGYSATAPASGGGTGAKDELLRVDAFSATGRLFNPAAAPNLDARMNLVFVDHGLVPLMVGEGYAAAAGKSRGDQLANLAAAADHMSKWDILDTIIHRRQAWGLLPAATTEIVGAAAAARGPAPFQIFPQWLGKASKRGKVRRWMSDLRNRGGLGTLSAAVDSRPALRAELFGATDASTVCDRLISLGLTRDDMMETLTETVFTGDEAAVKLDAKLKAAITREWKKRGVESNETNESAETMEADYISSDEEYDLEDAM